MFMNGKIREEIEFNAVEYHFQIDMKDDRTLAIRGDEQIRFADVVRAKEGMTKMIIPRTAHTLLHQL